MTHRQSLPSDDRGRQLVFASADLKARMILIAIAETEYDADNKRGAARFCHAEAYLRDRVVYELAPWPKNCIMNPEYVEAMEQELTALTASKEPSAPVVNQTKEGPR